MKNEFNCLSNALLQASLRCGIPAAFLVPERVRDLVAGTDVRDVQTVTIHQCPNNHESTVDYRVMVNLKGRPLLEHQFQTTDIDVDHDTFVLYDQQRDGRMQHMHLLH